MKVRSAHLHVLCAAKRWEDLRRAALDGYGAGLHAALRSRREELRYLRTLTDALLPYLMPPKTTDCRYRDWVGSAGTRWVIWERRKRPVSQYQSSCCGTEPS